MVERNAASEPLPVVCQGSLLLENGVMDQCLMFRGHHRGSNRAAGSTKTPAYRHQHFQRSTSMAKVSLRSGLSSCLQNRSKRKKRLLFRVRGTFVVAPMETNC